MKQLTFLFLLIWSSLSGFQLLAQEADSSRIKPAVDLPAKKEKKEKPEKLFVEHDLRVGVDLSTIILGAITPVRSGIDLSLEYKLTHNWFLMLEAGQQTYEKETEKLHYKSDGQYFRLGADYNLRKSVEKNDRDIYYIGFRYGFSRYEQEIPFYNIYNSYWGNSQASIAPEKGTAHWMEVVTGFKVEILKNFYVGMGMRLKTFIKRSKTNIEPVQFVPGYARNYNSGVFNFNYTVYYNIPLNYKKQKIAVYEKGQ